MNIHDMIQKEIENGYSEGDAEAKVCQDIILKAISDSTLNRNITIKGGVVMRSLSGSIRRATQDLDIDFIRLSLKDSYIDSFISKLNVLNDITISRVWNIKELKQQDYHGKRVNIEIVDAYGTTIKSKIDLGVHNRLDIKQEEYIFDIAYDDEGASLLINSTEQMFTEKLKSLLRFGTLSTRYKDIFDLYYLIDLVNSDKLRNCFKSMIYDDSNIRENNIEDVITRISFIFNDDTFVNRIDSSDKKWIDEDINIICKKLISFIKDF